MKNLLCSILFLCSFSLFGNAQETNKSLKVSGTCGMCKKKIEEVALANGASKAEWDKKSKMLEIYFDAGKANEDQIKKAIADAGYDNDGYKASDAAYNQLHECCKYDRSGAADAGGDSCGKKEKCKRKSKCSKDESGKKCESDATKACCKNSKAATGKKCCKD